MNHTIAFDKSTRPLGQHSVRILQFDFSKITNEKRAGLPHIWHGELNGRMGLHATRVEFDIDGRRQYISHTVEMA